MRHRLVLQLRSAAPCDWVVCGIRLAELCRTPALRAAEGVELIRLRRDQAEDPAAVDAVLVVRCIDAEQLRAASELIGPWLVEFGLIPIGSPTPGDVVFDSDRRDDVVLAGNVDPDHRVAQFVTAVVEAGAVWGLYDETWARAPVAGHDETLPFWPTAHDAANSASGVWRTFASRAIELAAFIEQWLPSMDEDGISVAVWPSPSEGVVITAGELARALATARETDR